ncbi:MAG: hypothetical protein ACI93R_000498 [Flavobacteriales bacterium]
MSKTWRIIIVKLLPLLIFLCAAFVFYRYIGLLPAEKRKAALVKSAVFAIIAMLILAVISGRMHWIGGVIAAALGMLKFGFGTLLRFAPLAKVLQKNNPFGDPVFHTKHVKATFNIQSGKLDGEIHSGLYSGKKFGELKAHEIEELFDLYKDDDKRSYYLLLVVRQQNNPTSKSQNNDETTNYDRVEGLSTEEARQTLGLDENYTNADINLAYKHLMQKLHPDRGGNDYLASRVNLARDVLLKTKNKR